MKVYKLYRKQLLPVSLERAWAYFSSPKNLNEITPPDMNFQILSGADEAMYTGQIIQYKINPIANIPLSWVTEITHCEDLKCFVDEQRFGPYKFWHHLHRFTPTSEGILMEDILHYALPMGLLGEILAGSFVQKKVEGIFDYRYQALERIFSSPKSAMQTAR